MRRKAKSIARHYARKGNAARAVYQTVYGAIPTMEFRFIDRDSGEVIEIEMTAAEAKEFLEEAGAAYSVIAPPLQFPRQTLY